MKRTKKGLAIILAVMMVFCYAPGMAFADTAEQSFVDMPNDWSTAALKSAVTNGLIKGYEGDGGLYIKPTGTLTRAEMATVVNRAFGASAKASLSGVSDIASGAWYEGEMAKAVQMGTMKKDSQMRPNANITRQEACTILARAFKMEASDASNSTLNQFADKGSIASWAEESLAVLVEKGYMTGSNGNLNPAANMTRAEFAKIMDNMVKTYIATAGTVESVPTGNVMINASGVTLKNLTVNGDLIIGDGVGNGEVTLDSVIASGDIIVRGGGVNSIVFTGDSKVKTVKIVKVDGNVRVAVQGNANVPTIKIIDGKEQVIVEGKVDTVEVAAASVPVVLQKANVKTVNVVTANADLTVAKDSTVSTVNVQKAAQGASVDVAGTVDKLNTAAPKTEMSITGKVSTISAEKSAEGSKIAISKDAKVDKLDTSADVKTSGEGKPGSVTGTGTVTNDKGETTKPSDKPSGGGGGSGGGSGGGDNGPASAPTLDSMVVSPTTGTGTQLDPYKVASAVNADDAYITMSIGKIENARTYKAEITIQNSNGTVRAKASASTIGSNINTLLNGRKMSLSDLSYGLGLLGDANSDIGQDLVDIFNNKMHANELYSMTVKITPVGFDSKSTTETIYLMKI